MKKRNVLYFLLYAVILMINILIVLSKKSSMAISEFSIPALFLMIAMIINGILSYLLRHKGNGLTFSRFDCNPFAPDRDYTFEESYTKRFFIMLKIYCLVIPFYIPQIFFASNYLQTLWALLTFFIPQIVFIIMGVTDILKDVKEYKAKTEQLEKERLLQEQREELGKWK
ncbi:MAG: hypothetical protein BHV88_13535 [Clostridiales bacterium 41_12_two_minus]|nr:MAG: hypothetical protein BHV88_13535 [Clostridiales bacterium 41_12_two_minus]